MRYVVPSGYLATQKAAHALSAVALYVAIARSRSVSSSQGIRQISISAALSVLGYGHRLGRNSLAGPEAEFVGHEMPGCGRRLAIGHLGIAALFDLGDQFVLHAKYHIGVDIFVAFDED